MIGSRCRTRLGEAACKFPLNLNWREGIVVHAVLHFLLFSCFCAFNSGAPGRYQCTGVSYQLCQQLLYAYVPSPIPLCSLSSPSFDVSFAFSAFLFFCAITSCLLCFLRLLCFLLSPLLSLADGCCLSAPSEEGRWLV